MLEIKRTLQDSIFTHLFSADDNKYLLEAYKALHPEDKDVTREDIKVVTLESILVNAIYNDLGFIVKDKLVVLVEAQSTWSFNILYRFLMYIGKTYSDLIYGENGDRYNIYSSSKVNLPKPEFYVLYTGNERKERPKEISLKEEFYEGIGNLDLKAKVIYKDDEREDILGQYIAFCHMYREEYEKTKDGKKAIVYAMENCKKSGNLVEYLKVHKKELEDITMAFITEEQRLNIIRSEARKEGLKQGVEQGLSRGRKEGLEQGIKQEKRNGLNVLLRSLKKLGLLEGDIASMVLSYDEYKDYTKDEILKELKEI